MTNPKSDGWERIGQFILDKITAPERFDAFRIEEEVIADICALAKGSHPKEMIAFLTGKIVKQGEERVALINGLYVKSYDADERSTWFTTHDLPLSGVFGTVHSHPGHSNRPSDADRRLFGKFGWVHLIVCEPYTKDQIEFYNKNGEQL